jgi:hypothetical protein
MACFTKPETLGVWPAWISARISATWLVGTVTVIFAAAIPMTVSRFARRCSTGTCQQKGDCIAGAASGLVSAGCNMEDYEWKHCSKR